LQRAVDIESETQRRFKQCTTSEEAQRTLPELTFRNEDEIRVARGKRLPRITDVMLFDHE